MTTSSPSPTRRNVLAVAGALVLAVAFVQLPQAATSPATPEGPGSASGAPHLPKGFTDTFTSRYIGANGVRLHAVIGGQGPPLVLIHGGPGSWYYWRLVTPALAKNLEVIAVDQRGIGLSDKPEVGYDTATLANDLAGLMDVLGHKRFAVVGVDTGMLIGYALAADHPDRVVRLAVGEAPLPGITPPSPLILPDQIVNRLWHIPFNQLKETNEKLVRGRESIFFGAEFSASAGTKKLPEYAVKYYVDGLASSQPKSFFVQARPVGPRRSGEGAGGGSRTHTGRRPEGF